LSLYKHDSTANKICILKQCLIRLSFISLKTSKFQARHTLIIWNESHINYLEWIMQSALPHFVAVVWHRLKLLVQVVEKPKYLMLYSHIFHLLHLKTLCRESDSMRPSCFHKEYQIHEKGLVWDPNRFVLIQFHNCHFQCLKFQQLQYFYIYPLHNYLLLTITKRLPDLDFFDNPAEYELPGKYAFDDWINVCTKRQLGFCQFVSYS